MFFVFKTNFKTRASKVPIYFGLIVAAPELGINGTLKIINPPYFFSVG